MAKAKKRITELAEQMDEAVEAAVVAGDAMREAEANLKAKSDAHQEARARVQQLHKEYSALMKDVLSFGGTVHVADI